LTLACIAVSACSADDAVSTVPTVSTVSTTTGGASTTPSAAAAWQSLVDEAAASSPGVPGISLAVLAPRHGLDVAVAAGDGGDGQLSPDQPFRIASNTKTFTAAATLRLVEDGVLGLDDPIGERVSPELLDVLQRDGYDVTAITLRHLLQHTSGLYDYASDVDFQVQVLGDPSRRWTREEQVRLATVEGDPLGRPGEMYAYSDTGYVLLGDVIERATGETLGAAYRELLDLDGLGLDSTWLEQLEPAPPGVAERAHEYFEDLDMSDADASFDLYGGGGLVSTVADLARFQRALVHGEVFDAPTTLTAMLDVPATNEDDGAASGLFRIDDPRLGRCWSHAGFWGSYVMTCPDEDVTIALAVFQASPDPPFDGERVVADAVALALGG
jgi:D-alanyl-D-alanine carboxypeptidase